VRSGVKVIPPERLHLTLVFLGNLPRERLGAFLALGAAMGAPPDEPLVLDRFECWARPRVACLSGPPPQGAWARFVERLAQESRALGAKVEHRPFRPHVTLARKVSPEAFDASGLGVCLPIHWPAAGFRLIRSESGPEGLRYLTAGEFS
jgi:2'-5' RNA ligase